MCSWCISVKSIGPYIVPLDMKGCICHFPKWQIHPFRSKAWRAGRNIVTLVSQPTILVHINVPVKHKTLSQCWCNVSPSSATLDQLLFYVLCFLGLYYRWILLCKAKRQYLLTCRVSRYGLSALRGDLSGRTMISVTCYTPIWIKI